MDSLKQTTDVLVVGAGMAGLIAARELLRAGLSVLVLDKGRGVGGRLASRRIEGATFDHGAQAFATGDAGGFPLAPALRQRLNAIEYDRCLAVMAVLEAPSRIPPPGGLLLDTGTIASITDNQRKEIPGNLPSRCWPRRHSASNIGIRIARRPHTGFSTPPLPGSALLSGTTRSTDGATVAHA